jgi:hypothetical protein
VRGVCDESAQSGLGGPSFLEGGFDLGQHLVQGQAQPTHLGPVIGRLDPAAEVARRDRARRGTDLFQRPEPSADQPVGEEPQAEQHRAGDDPLDHA